MKRFFLSRKTVIGLLTILLFLVLLSYIIPQSASVTWFTLQQWRGAYPRFARIADLAGLHHLLATPWFAVPLLLFFISLCMSCLEQVSLARRKTSRSVPPGAQWVAVPRDGDAVSAIAGKLGYKRFPAPEGYVKFVKHPWGYWGNSILHIGLVIVMLSSIFILLTQRRGMLRLEEGQAVLPPVQWTAESHGLLADTLALPGAVRLKELDLAFWGTDQMSDLQSSVAFFHQDGGEEEIRLRINEPQQLAGLMWYQIPEAGNNFYLEFIDQYGNRTDQVLMFLLPPARDRASYNDFRLDWMPYTIRAKYFVDEERKSMVSRNPFLVLRLYQGDQLLGELPLGVGESGRLGMYQVRLAKSERWTGILVVSNMGMPGIYLGFFVLAAGASLIFFAPPRQVILRMEEKGFSLCWNCERFEDFYDEEFDKIMTALGRT